MRICVVYDCLYPHTVGGAERWYRNLAERLAADGDEVTFLTLRQWDRGVDPGVPGVDVRVVGPRMQLYSGPGQRRILPPLVFGLGVFLHLLRHGRRYDAVHTASFPYFSVLAAAITRFVHRFALVVDWHEVWTREYWNEYLGRRGGLVGWLVQALCIRVRQRAFCFSKLHAARLREGGLRGEVTILTGEYRGSLEPRTAQPAVPPTVVFAGRHIPEKQAPALVPAIAAARHRIAELRGRVLGDGPERELVLSTIADLGLEGVVDAPGFVSTEEVDEALGSALCMLLPSRREGYGMVVVEAASRGTPSVVVAAPDNAATELIEPGVNGFIAPSTDPAELADAIIAVADGGHALREQTAAWFARNAERLSIEGSLRTVVASYHDLQDAAPAQARAGAAPNRGDGSR